MECKINVLLPVKQEAITRNQSPQGLSVWLIKMYGPSWDMAVVATAALT